MAKIQNTKNNEKMAEYCKTCICKSCEQVAWLEPENDRLKAEIKQLEDFIKSDGEIDHINHEYTYKLKQTLQEIREYAESIGNEEMINGYAIRAKSALWRIANKITKAEEE